MNPLRLSLCLIVRDEAAMLPGMIASVTGLWDELIAVDTGSRDETVSLLEEAGARVLHRPWDDDFAAARNASIAPATGDWILFLDADERIDPEAASAIRGLMSDDGAGAATVLMRNELPGGHRREKALLRLFRNDPSIRFEHRIHEDIATPVQAYLARSGRRLVHLAGHVEHLGYRREVASARAKKERDLTLLRDCLDENPWDFYSRYKLLELARFWSDQALWQATAQELAPLLAGLVDGHGSAPHGSAPAEALPELAHAHFGGELIALLSQGLHSDPAAALAFIESWTSRVIVTPPLLLHRGALCEQLGDLMGARDDYEACRRWADWPVPQQVSVRPLLGLCRLDAAGGDLDAASERAAEAVAAFPRDPEALHAAIAFTWLRGRDAAVAAFAVEYEVSWGETMELKHALGEHALSKEQWRIARQHLTKAAGQPPAGPAAIALAQAELACGDVGAAAAICASLAQDIPAAALGLLTCALLNGSPFDHEVDLPADQATLHFQDWIGLLWRSRRTELMESFVDQCGSVVHVFPWLPEYLQGLTQQLHRVGCGRD